MKRAGYILGALLLCGCEPRSQESIYVGPGPKEYSFTVQCEDEREPTLVINKNNRTKAVVSCEEIK